MQTDLPIPCLGLLLRPGAKGKFCARDFGLYRKRAFLGCLPSELCSGGRQFLIRWPPSSGIKGTGLNRDCSLRFRWLMGRPARRTLPRFVSRGAASTPAATASSGPRRSLTNVWCAAETTRNAPKFIALSPSLSKWPSGLRCSEDGF